MVIRVRGKGGMGSPSDTPLAPYSAWGCSWLLVHFRVYGWGCAMAYYEVLIEVWCNWDPRASDLEEIDVLRCGRGLFDASGARPDC